MSDPRDTPDGPREAVGEDRPRDVGNREGFPGYLRLQGAMWVVVILVALVFVAAILFAATR